MTTAAKKASKPKKPPEQRARTVAERVAAFRARLASTGQAEVRGIYAQIPDHPEIKQAAAKIIRRRARGVKDGQGSPPAT